ncbi:hypothetical protein [Polaribacter uvawellassae]|uniref:hypothetical protein n=1 Tax=Polaribacter uvawellassae TaxID=3133495 RepID=UPI00321A6C5C
MKHNSYRYILLFSILFGIFSKGFSQKIIENYTPKSGDSLRIGTTNKDFIPLIKKGFTLSLPKGKNIKGVLIFLEDSGFDKKNKSAKQIYKQAISNNFATLSVSSEIPFDFYFSKNSALHSHKIIKQVFEKYHLPNNNIFFIGVGLSGHRAMKHIEFMIEDNYTFQLNIKGIVVCNSILDWSSEWYKFDREIRNKRNDLWEPTFVNYMLEKNLKGTPKNNIQNYFNFSTYSYFDEKNDNIKYYKNYAVRAYIEPAIKYWLKKRGKTMYDNNSPDMVGLLAELELRGNNNTELIVLQPEDNTSQIKNPDSTWRAIDKDELMRWIKHQLN